MAKKLKKGMRKAKAERKPQPLPRSVKALLSYLGGSDVKLGGARPQQATIAPATKIYIQMPQQQQRGCAAANQNAARAGTPRASRARAR